MNRIVSARNLRCLGNLKYFNRTASSAVTDQFHHYDATPEEIQLVNKRLKLKKALRAEYLRKVTDPHTTDPIVFDPQVQRYYSMHMTVTERFIPTVKNWFLYMFTVIVPIVSFALYLTYSKGKTEKQIRSGQIPYKDRIFKFQ